MAKRNRKHSSRTRSAILRTRSSVPVTARLTLLGVGGLLLWGLADAAPRIAVNALPNGPAGLALAPGNNATGVRLPQVVAGSFANPYAVNGNTATIKQDSPAGILRWASFDIGADARVNVDLPSSTAVLLNKIDGGEYMNKTVIEGMLSGSKGHVYIYNSNGIIFGKNSVVDLNTFVATTLKVDDARFLSGLMVPSSSPQFDAENNAPGAIIVEGERVPKLDTNGNVVKDVLGNIVYVTNRAHLTAAQSGKILLIAPTIENNGVISAPDGQVALIAGGRVYLTSPNNKNMRGFLIEVDNRNLASLTSSVTNQTLGEIRVERGNATLVGHAVNQEGLVSATTSVALNGSIYLHARDTATKSAPETAAVATRGGNLVLGAGSVTQVMPDLADGTLTEDGTFVPTKGDNGSYQKSVIDLSGNTIHLLSGASVVAPAGDVTLTARSNPASASPNSSSASRIYLEDEATIDVSGTTTNLAMEDNVLEVELRGSELADVPLQRSAVFRGDKVKIDIRKGTPLANVTSWLAGVKHNVSEMSSSGGTVTLQSDGDVILARGSRVDVSGGGVNYRDGYVSTTKLTAAGRVFDIGSATADRIYDGVVAKPDTPDPRDFQRGYWQGSSAGTIIVDAPHAVLRGDLKGNASAGPLQRDVSATDFPKGGQLIIGNKSDNVSAYLGFDFLGRVDIGGNSTAGIATPGFSAAWDADNNGLKATLDLNVNQLAVSGFSRIGAYTLGDIVVSNPVTLAAGGEMILYSQYGVNFNAGVAAPGGTLKAASAIDQVAVASGVSFDLAGRWTNDRSASPAPLDGSGNFVQPIVTGGGSVDLSGLTVAIGDAVSMDVSAGAWQSSAGKTSAGKGGSIVLKGNVEDKSQALDLDGGGRLLLGEDVVFKGYGVSNGGKISLSGRNVVIGAAAPNADDLSIDPAWFRDGGFSSYAVTAAGNLTVAEGVTVAPRMQSWMIGRNTATQASGRMADAYAIGIVPVAGATGSRGAASVSLSAASAMADGYGRLWLRDGASIVTDPGGSVTLAAGRQLTVEGTVRAEGGNINLYLTPGSDEVPYRAERSVWLGSAAVLDASGTAARIWSDSTGMSKGEVLDGGRIQIGRIDKVTGNFTTLAGYVVAEEGARLDVSGSETSMVVSNGRLGRTQSTVASAGGVIDIRAQDGILFDGTFSAAGGNTTAAGGSLSLVLDREGILGAGYSAAPRHLVVARTRPLAGTPGEGIVPVGLDADRAITGQDGLGYVLADTLNHGGFDRIRLKSQDLLTFDVNGGNLGLSSRASLTLDAPLFSVSNAVAGSSVNLSSAYVQLGNADWRYQAVGAAAVPAAGAALFGVTATTIDLVGRSVLQGASQVNLAATEDIRLAGQVDVDINALLPDVLSPIHAVGSFTSSGAMSLTASQIYPTTLSEFSLMAIGSGSSITFNSNGHLAYSPLSAAGALTVKADDIYQYGLLRAPFGRLQLEATDNLVYGANSVTSVAGSGKVPLGRVTNGRQWLYDFGNGYTVALNDTAATNGVVLPEKAIISKARAIIADSSAVIDLSGGGELYGYEFTAGPGGSKDILAASSGTTYAILPGYAKSMAPRDFQMAQDSGVLAGERIYLSGIPGLTAGYYTLLPAHYALLDGAYAISVLSGTRDMSAQGNYAKLDQRWVVAGYRGSVGSAESRWSGYQVMSNSLVRSYSEFANYSANTFFSGADWTRPADGGHIAFAVTDSLQLGARMKLQGTGDGRRGIADISAPEIAVVADASQDTGTAVKLLASDLTSLGADSLLLGGLRETASDGTTHVTVGAQRVILANDAQHPLSGAEIILAALDTVTAEERSSISGAGTYTGTRANLVIEGSGSGADGALLRVSAGSQRNLVRNAPAGISGTLDIKPQANLNASGSMNLDATMQLNYDGDLGLGIGAELNLGARRISLGESAPGGVPGLRFSGARLEALNNLSSLALTSYSTLDLYGPVTLGRSATVGDGGMKTLTLRAAGIQAYGHGAGDTSSLLAETVRFEGGGAFSLVTPAPVTPAGALAVTAKTVEVGSSTFDIRGVQQVDLTAKNEIRMDGKAGVLSAQGAMTANAGRFTASSAKDGVLLSTGQLTLGQVESSDAASARSTLGGRIGFAGGTIESNADIIARSGAIAMTAGGGVHIAGGKLDVSGTTVTFGSKTAYSGGGRVTLDGGSGLVQVDAPVLIDVSAVRADAGTLTVKSLNGTTGTAILAGTLKAESTAGSDGKKGAQGNFIADLDRLASFGGLNQILNAAGFGGTRQFSIRHQDNVNLAANETITARDVLVAVDNGNLIIGGTIDARGDKGGSIQLFASQATASGGSGNITLAGTSRLLAASTFASPSAAGSAGDGGRVIIGTANAAGTAPATVSGNSSISLESGTLIDVSGAGSGQAGSVILRAPRVGTGAGTDVAITAPLAGTISGSGETVIEGYKVYTGTQITAAAGSASNLDARTTGAMYTEAATFAGNKASILSRLGAATDVKLRTGIEVRSSGDLLVNVNETNASAAKDRGWDLNVWRFGGEPGVLTLRAAKDLTIKGSISDGFVKPTTATAMPDWKLDASGGSSWSYRLVGGARADGANPLAVNASSAWGDMKLAFQRTATSGTDQAVALVRTGSGTIEAAAGRDIVLETLGSGTTALGAVIYTAGRHVATQTSDRNLPDYTAADPTNAMPRNQTANTAYTGAAVTLDAEFATGGGAISLDAARNIVGPATYQVVDNWFFRRGKTSTDASGNVIFAQSLTGATTTRETLGTAWWVRYDLFNQGVAALAGGDVKISAGRNVYDLAVSTVTNAQMPGVAPGVSPLVERGGGDLRVNAGGDIYGGSFYVQKGLAVINAGGSITSTAATPGVAATATNSATAAIPATRTVGISQADGSVVQRTVHTVLALGDATMEVTAGGDLEIETILNPTMTRQSTANAAKATATTSASNPSHYSYFSTYGADSNVSLTSLTGKVALDNDAEVMAKAVGSAISSAFDTSSIDRAYKDFYAFYPGSFHATALSGNLILNNGFSLAPSAVGQLDLLAAGSVTASFPGGVLSRPVAMLDLDPNGIPNIYAPRMLYAINTTEFDRYKGTGLEGLATHKEGGLHTGDAVPVSVVALTGDVTGYNYFTSLQGNSQQGDTLVSAKKAEIIAGRDIIDFGYRIQHLDANDISRVEAGRDIIDTTNQTKQSYVRHIITGAGRLDVEARRNIDLGNSRGISSRGNLDNPYLAEGGAALDIVAGATPDFVGFARQNMAVSDLSSVDQMALIAYMHQMQPTLPAGLDAVAAWTAFNQLSADQRMTFLEPRKALISTRFFALVKAASKKPDGTLNTDLAKFDGLIASLFPVADIGGGDINVFGSQLKTEQGGGIDLFTPGGSVYAGLSSPPAYLRDKSDADLGIFTVRGGTIQALVKNDFLVNQGRVFTLGGGDITLVSQYHDIDAGKGAKTASSAPPPLLTTDPQGNTVIDISSSISGSGIATLKTRSDVPDSNVSLVAPRGTVSAGDAGVKCSGTCDVVAVKVNDPDNFAGGKGLSGVAKADSGGMTAMAAPSNSTATKTDSFASAAPQDPTTGRTLSVEVIGYGGDAGQLPVTQSTQNAGSSRLPAASGAAPDVPAPASSGPTPAGRKKENPQ